MKRVIGVIGTIAAGKDVVADYLASKLGAPKFEISAGLKEIAAERNIEPTRENLVLLGRNVALERGHAFLAKRIFNKAPELSIVSGIRQLPQIEFFRTNSDFTLIAVDADPEIRFKRATDRGKVGEAKTVAEFVANEQAENSGEVQRLFDCMKLADIILVNNGSVDELRSNVDGLTIQA